MKRIVTVAALLLLGTSVTLAESAKGTKKAHLNGKVKIAAPAEKPFNVWDLVGNSDHDQSGAVDRAGSNKGAGSSKVEASPDNSTSISTPDEGVVSDGIGDGEIIVDVGPGDGAVIDPGDGIGDGTDGSGGDSASRD